MTIPKAPRWRRGQEEAEEWRLDCDPVARFVAEKLTIDPGAKTSAGEVYEAYTEWCEGQGHHRMARVKLGRELARLKVGKGRTKSGRYYKCKVRSVLDAIDDAIDGNQILMAL